MTLGQYSSQAQTISGGGYVSAGSIFGMSDAERVAAMKAMGAKNVDPPLVRSSHLKNTKTGIILPWNEMLAEQRDIMVNCDANGNTDPLAWMPTVKEGELSDSESMERLHAQSFAIQQGNQLASGFKDPAFVDPNIPQQQAYPDGVTAVGDTKAEDIISEDAFQNLLAKVKG